MDVFIWALKASTESIASWWSFNVFCTSFETTCVTAWLGLLAKDATCLDRSSSLAVNAEIVGDVEVELLKVKHLYEKKVPKRSQRFAGLQVYSKYNVGEDLGGEFFDLYKKDNNWVAEYYENGKLILKTYNIKF